MADIPFVDITLAKENVDQVVTAVLAATRNDWHPSSVETEVKLIFVLSVLFFVCLDSNTALFFYVMSEACPECRQFLQTKKLLLEELLNFGTIGTPLILINEVGSIDFVSR